jgi:hypothetical protein
MVENPQKVQEFVGAIDTLLASIPASENSRIMDASPALSTCGSQIKDSAEGFVIELESLLADGTDSKPHRYQINGQDSCFYRIMPSELSINFYHPPQAERLAIPLEERLPYLSYEITHKKIGNHGLVGIKKNANFKSDAPPALLISYQIIKKNKAELIVVDSISLSKPGVAYVNLPGPIFEGPNVSKRIGISAAPLSKQTIYENEPSVIGGLMTHLYGAITQFFSEDYVPPKCGTYHI